MRIHRRQPLQLKVNVFRAADLFLAETKDRHGKLRQVNASFVVQFNHFKKRCRRKFNTPNPSWDASFAIPLTLGDASDLLVLTVWNKSSGSKTYMGEIRLQVRDLFKESLTTSPTWYKLYLSEARHGYITGLVLILFQLVTKNLRSSDVVSDSSASERPYTSTNNSTQSIPKLRVEAPTVLQSENVKEENPVNALFLQWLSSLVHKDAQMPTSPNEQGFYSNIPDEFQPSGTSDLSDVDSLMEDRPFTVSSSSLTQQLPEQHPLAKEQFLSVGTASDCPSSDFSDSEMLSLASVVPKNDLYGGESPINRIKGHRRRHLVKNRDLLKHEVRKRDLVGVLFLEIVSCSDLPPIKNFTRTTFDMDPFVVVTFGKKTFRTSWKRHKLNPIYNERLAFEVMAHELDYNIKFSVLDKDRFSFHDQVGEVSLSMSELVDIAKVPLEEKMEKPLPFADRIIGAHNNDSKSSLNSFSDWSSTNPAIELAEDANIVRTRRKKLLKKRTTFLYVDTSMFRTLNLSFQLKNEKMAAKHSSTLKVRARFLTYERLRKDFWIILLEQYGHGTLPETMDHIELMLFLDVLGSANSDEIVSVFFKKHDKSMWGGDKLDTDEIVQCLEEYVLMDRENPDTKIFEIEKCPICEQHRFSKKGDLDIVTHVAICASKDWSLVNKLLESTFATPELASRRWYSKILIKLTYGQYKLGSNSANILVQDRSTGLILEEKMNITVRVGIRLLYKGLDKPRGKRIRTLLRKLSIKQGVKFDSPLLQKDIQSFINFHKLDMTDCLLSDPKQFATFNDFFYRKLKPDARPVEAKENENIAVSPADCRCITYTTVDEATQLWIKGRNFSLAKLFNGNFNNLENTDLYKAGNCCVGIFRLAPQDYHRFHSPVKGVIGPIKYIEGEYYTVNPMAIRSDLDVYGENVRVLIPIETEKFGTMVLVAVGAMMVGSTVLTVKEGQQVERGQEVGYFKFGGSTVLLLFQKDKFVFDSDLVNNSKQCVETLVRVGQSIGHTPDVPEFKRRTIDITKQPKEFRNNVIRTITGGDLSEPVNKGSWEMRNFKVSPEDMQVLEADNEADLEDLLKSESEYE